SSAPPLLMIAAVAVPPDNASVLPAPITAPLEARPAPSARVPAVQLRLLMVALLWISNVPPLIVTPLAVPPDETVSMPPLPIVVVLAVALARTVMLPSTV